jgi:AcrR family transcriptional regulator
MTKLTRDMIVTAAVDLLDAEGMDGLSMRRLGARLGAGATSLYWHVPSKDELASAVMDQVLADLEFANFAETGWRPAAESLARGLRALVIAHPWFALASIAYASYGPAAARMYDHSLAIFEAAGFTGNELNWAVSAVFAYVQGATVGEAAWRARIGSEGHDVEEYTQQVITRTREAAAGYPRLLALYDQQADVIEAAVSDENFEFGLAAVLDGLEARVR